MLTKDDDWVDRFKADPLAAARGPLETALVAHAVKLTEAPASIDKADIAALEQVGLGERAVLDLTLVVGYFNMVNRIADGLGIPLEAGFPGT